MSDFTPPRPPKPLRPLDVEPRPLRPPGTIWIRKHHRHDRFKGWTVIKGHWRGSEPRKPKNPGERFLDFFAALSQNGLEAYLLLNEADATMEAYRAWNSSGTRLLHECNDVPVETDQPDALCLAAVAIQRALLKAAVANLDDAALAEAGLQRRTEALRPQM
jgi:hypothetical protein